MDKLELTEERQTSSQETVAMCLLVEIKLTKERLRAPHTLLRRLVWLFTAYG